MVPAELIAIVLDASAFGGGQFDRGLASDWAAACETHGVELWIPEPVFLELAEHAITDDTKRIEVLRAQNRARAKVGLSRVDVPVPLTLEAFRDLVESAGATIIEVEPADALEALKDQTSPRSVAQRRGKKVADLLGRGGMDKGEAEATAEAVTE